MKKKYPGPHACVLTGASQDHLRLDLNMIANIILLVVDASPQIEISLLIVNIHSQYQYTPTELAYVGQIARDGTYCDDMMQEIRRNTTKVKMMYVVCHSHQNFDFRVMEHARSNQEMLGASYRMNLTEETYDCKRFQTLQFSCAHTITACENILIEYAHYINDVYQLQHIRSVWSPEFPPIPNGSMWSLVSSALFELVPNKDLHHISKGHLNSTRIKNNMDIRERYNQ
ncbi:hypothetical protein PVK06_005433 [Gossypium arboreum]|uniref:Uncharacterized protein n=1 Tax=Gossypium arboreum TaxID=29729 RepID=A0ABR0QVK9_GOSAR|nr:hypothetical protein PVK06_005433 [Gossypium arboreum]